MTTTPNGTAFDVGRLVCAQLDGLMTRAGFAPGQIGVAVDEASVVYCAQFEEFRDRFPLVAPEIDYSGDKGACTDLNIYVDVGDVPRLTETRLDGTQVGDLLRGVGRDDLAPQASALHSLPLPGALKKLEELLREVFFSDRSIAGQPECKASGSSGIRCELPAMCPVALGYPTGLTLKRVSDVEQLAL